jgi:hypothetical protein
MTNYVGVCWGNHDVGYRHKKLNFESLVKCHQLSPLFWWHPVGGILFLGICSPLLDQYEGEGEETVNMLALEQVSLIEEVLRKNRNEKWILCTHDLSVDHLDHYVGSYKKNLVKVISGHVHSTRGLAMEKIKGRFGSSFSSYCRRLLVGCPAVAPLWWHGGSCLTGEVLGERVSVNTHLNLLSMELQDRIKKSPFNTFLKCVLKSIWDVPRFREVLSK